MRLRRRIHPYRLSRHLTWIVHGLRKKVEPVLVPDTQCGHERKVIYARHGRVDVVHRYVEHEAEPELQSHELVAKTYRLHPRRLRHSAA